MKQSALTHIISEFESENIRYLIVGGLAVVFYGYLRLTTDIDIVIDFEQNNIDKAIVILKKLGYQPLIPVNIDDFADSEIRKKWIEEKNIIVFSLISQNFIETPIDIFVDIPFCFHEEYKNLVRAEIASGVFANFLSYERLIKMKQLSNRELDISDIQHLEQLYGK
ncbi:MAG: hypothetical protein NT007_18495 [Candidatus Kapabacteria bacterium]|nr:hypothetical protein [Candidatus Kapabacteria bacterium]